MSGAHARRQSSASWLLVALCGVAPCLLACGSRTRLSAERGDATPCQEDTDCEQSDLCDPESCVAGFCERATPVICRSDDPCLDSVCVPATGECETAPLTPDLDGDGFRAPLAGTAPGEPGSCGDDCDDTNRRAFPGGLETCDGADNDCDGVIDNGTNYLETFELAPTLLALEPQSEASGRRGVAYGEGLFVAGYWARNDSTRAYLQAVDESPGQSAWRQPVSNAQAPSFGADVAWLGDSFGATWADPRLDDNYEVYFARFAWDGSKLGPDLRISQAEDFSIHSRILFDQGRTILVWDDRRDEAIIGGSRVYAQVLNEAGTLLGPNLPLTSDGESAEVPVLAATATRFGLVYTELSMGVVQLRVRTFDKEFEAPSTVLTLAAQNVRAPRIISVGEQFVVTWDDYATGPGPSILGAVVSEQGALLVAPRPITAGASFARSHDTLSLGDRFLLFWSDDFADDNYELYAQVLDLSLNVLEPRVRLTSDPADTLSPEVALGGDGRVGVLFDDFRSGSQGVYFTSVGCPSP